jgi:Kef-type K+ transport system membrane component KefB/predicted transcriptional regulator
MSNLLVSAGVEISDELNLVLLLGLIMVGGTFGAQLFQRIHIPQVVGYVSVGIVLGPCLNIISQETVETLEPFSLFTLGVIGFLIGGELKRQLFAKFGRQVAAILLLEGGVAFLLVTLLTFVTLHLFYDWQVALAVAVVFGAICSATDPASTVNILWEYKARGPLTSMLIAIVALDDALALVLYISSVGIAGLLTGHRAVGFLPVVFHSFYEIVGSLGLGMAAAFVIRCIIKRVENEEKILILTVSIIVLIIGLAIHSELDVILSSMACGVTLINLSPRRSLKSFELVAKFSPPLLVLFFVSIGARLNISLTGSVWLLAGTYITGSIIGKTAGSYLGAVHCNAVATIRRYLGFCLYQQGTIAMALLIMASRRFEGPVRDMMISVIVAGIFVLQLIGPVITKIGIKKAGEAGLNITEDDLIKTFKVADVMDTRVPVISAGTLLSEVIRTVSTTDNSYYPVADNDKKLLGAITLGGIRNTFATQELNDWLVALDIMEPIIAKIAPEMPLSQALERARQLDVQHLPIVASGEDDRIVGILDCEAVRRSLSAEVLSRQQKADSIHSADMRDSP